MHEDRFFDSDASVRRLARTIYERTSALPIVSPHGHVDPRLLAEDAPFPEPTALFILPDHYVLRMLYSQGVPLERLGIEPKGSVPDPDKSVGPVPLRNQGQAPLLERDPRRIWQLFAEHYYLFRGTPTAAWLDYQFEHIFGIQESLDAGSAQGIYDEIAERLATSECRPRALFGRFRIEVLATTDAASDPLDQHARIRASGWTGRVIPTFRPDGVFHIASPTWEDELASLAHVAGRTIDSLSTFIATLAERRVHFKSLGATATDHGVETPYTASLREDEADEVFQRARVGTATPEDQRRFVGHMLMVMAAAVH